MKRFLVYLKTLAWPVAFGIMVGLLVSNLVILDRLSELVELNSRQGEEARKQLKGLGEEQLRYIRCIAEAFKLTPPGDLAGCAIAPDEAAEVAAPVASPTPSTASPPATTTPSPPVTNPPDNPPNPPGPPPTIPERAFDRIGEVLDRLL